MLRGADGTLSFLLSLHHFVQRVPKTEAREMECPGNVMLAFPAAVI